MKTTKLKPIKLTGEENSNKKSIEKNQRELLMVT